MYGAATALGSQIEFKWLVQEKYIGCSLGSSLEELRLAAEDHDLSAWPLGGMTQDFLARSSFPVILHVKQSAAAPIATHYVLFLGWADGGAKIVDPGKPARLISATELASIWSGDGMLVAPKGTSDFAAIIKPSILTFLSIPIAAVAAGLLYLAHCGGSRAGRVLAEEGLSVGGASEVIAAPSAGGGVGKDGGMGRCAPGAVLAHRVGFEAWRAGAAGQLLAHFHPMLSDVWARF